MGACLKLSMALIEVTVNCRIATLAAPHLNFACRAIPPYPLDCKTHRAGQNPDVGTTVPLPTLTTDMVRKIAVRSLLYS